MQHIIMRELVDSTMLMDVSVCSKIQNMLDKIVETIQRCYNLLLVTLKLKNRCKS